MALFTDNAVDLSCSSNSYTSRARPRQPQLLSHLTLTMNAAFDVVYNTETERESTK